MQLRKSEERGYFEIGWLKSHHSFSFGEYYDPRHMGFSDLRVINHDYVAPSAGFPMHPHKDMEIVSYVLRGRVAHQDSMGNKKVVNAGEVQVMSAGRGVTHSEYNPDPKEEFEMIQIWILPSIRQLVPSYDQKAFAVKDRVNRWQVLVSPDQIDGSLKIHQDAQILATIVQAGQELSHQLPKGRKFWLQTARGAATVNGQSLRKGDALSFSENETETLTIRATEESEFVLFNLRP